VTVTDEIGDALSRQGRNFQGDRAKRPVSEM
jgi:hypothetical protein